MPVTYQVVSLTNSTQQVTSNDMGHGQCHDDDEGQVEVEVEVQEVEEAEPLMEADLDISGAGGEVEVDESGTTTTVTVPLNFNPTTATAIATGHRLTTQGEVTVPSTRLVSIPMTAFSLATINPYTVPVPYLSPSGPLYMNNDEATANSEIQENIKNIKEELIKSPSPSVTSTSSTLTTTWDEAVASSIIPVRCKDTNGEFYKAKFGSGNKGKCVKHGDDWFTPTEFEAFCGRGNSKDWKRSIRFGGRTLQTLIDKGHLTLHASACICSSCVDDQTATGPIRPFTPYQRKRKNPIKGNEDSKKIKTKLESFGTDESSDNGTPMSLTPEGLLKSVNPLNQAFHRINNLILPSCTQEAWRVVEDAVDTLVTASVSLKTIVHEMKKRTNEETESLRSQLQAQNSVQATFVQNPVSGSRTQLLRIFDSNRMQTYQIEVMDGDSFNRTEPQTQLQSNSALLSFKCQNCGRDGSLECSGCHVVHYCSSFCQKKDWHLHQAACHDSLAVECKEEPVIIMK